MKTWIHIVVATAGLSLLAAGCRTATSAGKKSKPVFPEEEVRLSEEVALTMVKLPSGLYMGKYEVTQAQWDALMEIDPSYFKGGDLPVERISWEDCNVFLARLNGLDSVKASGFTFSLPTEKDWEYACRAKSKGDYCRLVDGTEVAKETLGTVAWYKDFSKKWEDRPLPVGQKEPNAFGLYDMHGNVWEWTSSPLGGKYVFRGGSWFELPAECTAVVRRYEPPDYSYYALGFRLAARRAEGE